MVTSLRLRLPQQLVQTIKGIVQTNPTTLVHNVLLYVEEKISVTPELPLDRDVPSITFTNHLFVSCVETRRHIFVKIVIRPPLTAPEKWFNHFQTEYVVSRNEQGKKDVLRLYHYLLMHFTLDEQPFVDEEVRQFLREKGPVRKKAAKVAVQTALEKTTTAPMPKWLQTALHTIRLHVSS